MESGTSDSAVTIPTTTFEQQVEQFYYSYIGQPFQPGIEEEILSVLMFWQKFYESGNISHAQFAWAKPYGFRLLKAVRVAARQSGYPGMLTDQPWIEAPNYDGRIRYRT